MMSWLARDSIGRGGTLDFGSGMDALLKLCRVLGINVYVRIGRVLLSVFELALRHT